MRSALLVLAATSFTLSTSRPADACSPPPCWGGAFVPGNHGRVPANAPALFWRPMFVYDDLTSHRMNVVLTRAADPTTPVPLTAQSFGFGDFLLAPNAPLAPGDYVLTDHTDCDEFGITGPQVAFTVGPTAPMPSELGTLTAIPEGVQPIELSTSLGSCSVQTPVAAAQIQLTPSGLVQDRRRAADRPLHHGRRMPRDRQAHDLAYQAMINVVAADCSDQRVIVKPGDPSASYLVDKLRGVDLCSGARMPPQGAPLSDADMARIEAWICQGAANN